MSTVVAARSESVSPPRRTRKVGVNWRLLVLLGTLVLPLSYVGWVVVSQEMNHGITRNGNYLEVDLKSLGNFPFHQENGTINDVPVHFRALDGKQVLLKGYMFSRSNSSRRGREFEFVYNVNQCCFDGAPQVQERVFGSVQSGRVELFPDTVLVRLTGTLHVRVVKDEVGVIHSVYDLDVEAADRV